METSEIVRSLARTRNRLAPDDERLLLDSMSVIEFTLALEEAVGVEIPNSELAVENFRVGRDVGSARRAASSLMRSQ